MTMPGPFTMAQQCEDQHYHGEEGLALDFAAAVNAEIKDLFAAGADVVQLDEPWLQARPEKARQYGLSRARSRTRWRARRDRGAPLLRLCANGEEQAVGLLVPARARALGGTTDLDRGRAAQPRSRGARQLPGKTIILGVIDLSDPAVESAETVAARIRRALPFVPADRIVVAPDCGMKYLPREVAFGKMQAMVEGARIVRQELSKN